MSNHEPLSTQAPAAGRTANWVLLWSQSQNATHVEPLEDMLRENRQAYTEDRQMDYVTIHIGPQEECYSVSKSIRHTMRQREKGRTDAN